MAEGRFTHVDASGRARMVDVSDKEETRRRAVAEGRLRVAPETVAALRSGRLAKGDALAVARLAAIQGAKRTPDLVPLCHPVRLDAVVADVEIEGPERIVVRVEAAARDRTGVEMEAMVGVAAGTLALYDMVKGADRGAEIEGIRLLRKEGGRSGAWHRDRAAPAGPPDEGS